MLTQAAAPPATANSANAEPDAADLRRLVDDVYAARDSFFRRHWRPDAEAAGEGEDADACGSVAMRRLLLLAHGDAADADAAAEEGEDCTREQQLSTEASTPAANTTAHGSDRRLLPAVDRRDWAHRKLRHLTDLIDVCADRLTDEFRQLSTMGRDLQAMKKKKKKKPRVVAGTASGTAAAGTKVLSPISEDWKFRP